MKGRTVWLVAAVALLVVAGLLLGRGESVGKSAERRARLERVQFPRYPKGDEYERMQRRKTLPPLPSPVPSAPPPDPSQGRDPLLSAVGAHGDVALVFEAGAFYRMPLAQQLLECFGADGEKEFERVREKTGIDVASIDRIAVTATGKGRSTVMAAAKFDPVKVAALLPDSAERIPHGDKGLILVNDGTGEAFGIWSDSVLMLGQSRSDVEAALDRIEGRAPPFVPAIPPEATYGEVYGHVRASYLAEMLPPEIAEAARVAKDVELHVDAMEDILVVADVTGDAPIEMEKLAKTMGGALSAARLTSRAQGSDDFAELLDLARVNPHGGSFTLEAAMPVEFIKKQLGGCAKR